MQGIRARATHRSCLALALIALACIAAERAFTANREELPTVFRYAGAAKLKNNLVLNLAPAIGGRNIEAIVPNNEDKREYDPNSEVVRVMEKVKLGDYLEVELHRGDGPRPRVGYVRTYDKKPGEELPNIYAYQNNYTQRGGREDEIVIFTKFQKETIAVVPFVRTESGKTEPDPQMISLLADLKAGEMVEVKLVGGNPLTIRSIERYVEPKTATFQKLTEEEEDGQSRTVMELQIDGEPAKAYLQGKTQRNKWVTDRRLLSAARRLKPGTDVRVTTREQDGKLWVRAFEVVKKPRPEAARAGRDERPMREADGEKK